MAFNRTRGISSIARARKSQNESVQKFLPVDRCSGALTRIESRRAILLPERVQKALAATLAAPRVVLPANAGGRD